MATNRQKRPGLNARRAVIALVLGCMPWAGLVPCARAMDKNGVGPNAVSLPDGPGSISGMGETFEPDLFTGTSKYAFGIRVPRSAADFVPSVALAYDAGNGNGPLGYGWELTIPYIQRKTSTGVPYYVDGPNGIDDDGDWETDEPTERDRFVTEEPENLVPQSDGFYFSARESAFVRYRRVGKHWVGSTPAGIKREYGLTASGRVADGASGRVFGWNLERETDPNGNVIAYSYVSFPGEENLNQAYLAKIEYGPGAPPWANKHFVAFEYEARPDWFETGRPTFPVRTGMRLKTILVGTQGPDVPAGHAAGDFDGDGTADFLNFRYEIAYEADAHWSLLSSITQYGADNVTAIPALRLEYTACNTDEEIPADDGFFSSVNTPLHLMDRPWVELSDLNGDGLPDVLQTDPAGGPHGAWLNLGETETGEGERVIKWGPRVTIGGDQRVFRVNLDEASGVSAHLADMNGDKRADLVYKSGDTVYYFSNEVAGGVVSWGARQRMAQGAGTVLPVMPYKSADVKTADVDGNKRNDLIQSVSVGNTAQYRVWLNLGPEGYAKAFTVPSANGPMFSSDGVDFADMNGDNLADMVRLAAAGMEVWTGFGRGVFGARRLMALPDYTLNDLQIGNAEVEDVTGDGLADLAIDGAVPNQLWFWENLGNYTFAPARRLAGTGFFFSENGTSRWADINGNGTTDLVYIDPLAVERLSILDIGELLGCVPAAHLLSAIDNGIGRRVTISYEASTRFLVADREEGMPWPDPVPFSVDVVSRVVTDDSFGNEQATRIAYHDGYYRADFLTFTGFARVDQIEEGDDSEPTLIRRFQFDTGRDAFNLRGKTLVSSAEDESGGVFWRETTRWVNRVLMTGVDTRTVEFPYAEQRIRETLERGAGTPVTTEAEYSYDNYGNVIAEMDYGVVDGADRSALHDERVERTEYALNLGAWLLRYPSRRTVEDLDGVIIKKSETFYDDPTFAGDNLGVATAGAKSMMREWRDPEDPGAYVTTGRILYDTFGNTIALLDPLAVAPGGVIEDAAGHYREIEYDGGLHAYPVTETIHLEGDKDDLVVRAEYDPGLGTVTAAENFSGHRTTYSYDPFGLLLATVEPGDTDDYPTAEYGYGLAEAVPGGGVVNYVETRLLDKTPESGAAPKRDFYFIMRRYVDGLGRRLMQKEEAERHPDTGAPRVAVTDASQFNARGSVMAVLEPFYTLDAPPGSGLDALLAYENIGKANWQGYFLDGDMLVPLRLDDAFQARTEYDATGRVTREVDALGAERRNEYEPLAVIGYDENDTDPASPFHDTPMVHREDGSGKLISTEEQARLNEDGTPSADVTAFATRFQYRADGLLTRIIDALNNEKWMEYDGLGRKTYLNDINRGEMRYTYDDAGNLIESLDAKGQRIVHSYDGANRPLTEDYLDEGAPFSRGFAYDPGAPLSALNRPDVVYFHDATPGEIDLGNGIQAAPVNTEGRLAMVWDLAGEEYNSFDARGRLAWVVKRLPDPLHGSRASFKTEMTYDAQGRLTSLIYPDADRCSYFYNDRNLVERIVGGGAAQAGAAIVDAIDYAPSEQRLVTAYGDGTDTRYSYDARGRLTRLVTGAGGADPILDYGYAYDNGTNIAAIHDLRSGEIAGQGDPRRNTQLFGYDALYRLTGAQYSFNIPDTESREDGSISFNYDPLGNLLSQTSDIAEGSGVPLANLGSMSYGGAAGTTGRIGRDFGEPGPHALTGITSDERARDFTYDANGNMTAMDGFAFTWDFRDRMASAESDSLRAEYVYDYTNRRILKRVWHKDANGALSPIPSEAVQYVGKHFEVRPHGEAVKYVFHGDTRVARMTGQLDPDADKVQRIRLWPGWNLAAITVEAADAETQFGIGGGGPVEAAFVFTGGEPRFEALTSGAALPAGSVCWLLATEAAVLSVAGAPAAPERDGVTAAGFYAWTGAEALETAQAFPETDKRLWGHDAAEQTWRVRLEGEPFLSDLPAFIEPGMPVYIASDAAAALNLPPAAAGLRFYHQDHLGSSNITSDATGAIVRETAFYPFGEPRNTYVNAPAGVSLSPYLFQQKERDTETGLHYFETRYLASALARFNRVDPAVETVPDGALRDPQKLNAYSFARNNPIVYTDPEGKFPELTPKQTIAKRLLDPFGDAKLGSDKTKAERRAAVFGALKFKKGEGLPEGSYVPPAWQDQIDGVKAGFTMGPNQLISGIAQAASNLQTKYKNAEKKDRLDADQLLNLILQKPGQSEADQKQRLDKFFDLGGKVMQGGDLSESPITKDGKLVNEDIAKQIKALQTTIGSLDLKSKFEEFSEIAKKQEFEFKQSEVDSFTEKYLDDKQEEKKQKEDQSEDNGN